VHGKGAKAVAFRSDQADTSRAPALIDDVVAHFGGLDILVNDAAISVAARWTTRTPTPPHWTGCTPPTTSA
jgi:NAD(P)-dependent dehydrogenase (short-subunit alcohol dehydrogenase family)